MKIGLLGGTFNPVHNGHINLAKFYKDSLKLDKIIFMPTAMPPHKLVKDLASAEDRINMLLAAIGDDECFSVSTIEIERSGKSYTYDTVCQLKELYPNDELFLIIGSDMFLSFDKWYKWQEISDNVVLCTAYRENSDNYFEMKNYAQNNLKLSDDKYYIGKFSPIVISSTEIRKKIRNGQNIGGLIAGSVEKYIKDKELYRE